MNQTNQRIPEIPGIDTHRVISTMGNDGEFFLELLEMFLTRYGDAAERVRTDLARGNRESAARLLHNLQGTAGSLGALELVGSVQALEETLVRSDNDPASLLEQVARQLALLKKGGAPWLPPK